MSFQMSFLKDVFICALGAYGGPEAHYGVFMDQLVSKKKYLQEEELLELIALCSILPGPTSTQTIVSVGYRLGGPKLAFLTMLLWALPAIFIMTALSFLYQILGKVHLSTDLLKYIGPMAVGFIVMASIRIGKKVIQDPLTLFLMIFGAVTTYFIRTPWIFPVVLILGGALSIFFAKEKDLWHKVALSPPWRYLFLFFFLALGAILCTWLWEAALLLNIFERFYRYGYLVFGGGQVVVPLMHSELVEVHHYMSNAEFLTGYGLVQGLPGPMFSFSAYAGGMVARSGGAGIQVLGALVAGIGIFLPGILLIYFIYPIWSSLRNIKAIRLSLRGINAVAGGLIAIAAVILMQKSGWRVDNIVVMAISSVLIATKKIPAPFIVLGALVAGVLASLA